MSTAANPPAQFATVGQLADLALTDRAGGAMKRRISVVLFSPDGRIWRYDGPGDGPLNEWLLATVPKLPEDFNRMTNQATITVFIEP